MFFCLLFCPWTWKPQQRVKFFSSSPHRLLNETVRFVRSAACYYEFILAISNFMFIFYALCVCVYFYLAYFKPIRIVYVYLLCNGWWLWTHTHGVIVSGTTPGIWIHRIDTTSYVYIWTTNETMGFGKTNDVDNCLRDDKDDKSNEATNKLSLVLQTDFIFLSNRLTNRQVLVEQYLLSYQYVDGWPEWVSLPLERWKILL